MVSVMAPPARILAAAAPAMGCRGSQPRAHVLAQVFDRAVEGAAEELLDGPSRLAPAGVAAGGTLGDRLAVGADDPERPPAVGSLEHHAAAGGAVGHQPEPGDRALLLGHLGAHRDLGLPS